MHKIIELSGHTVEIIDFSRLVSAAPAEVKADAGKKAPVAKKVEVKKEDAHQLGIEYTKE